MCVKITTLRVRCNLSSWPSFSHNCNLKDIVDIIEKENLPVILTNLEISGCAIGDCVTVKLTFSTIAHADLLPHKGSSASKLRFHQP